MSARRIHGAAALVAALLGLTWLPEGRAAAVGEGGEEPAAARGGYVDDALCADCHEGIAEGYRDVAMARSFDRPGTAPRIEDFEHARFHHALSDRHYEMSWRGDELWCRRWRLDAQGRPFNVLEQRVDWIMGSGNHARVYLYATEGGEMYQLPVAWYTQDGRWDMAPGYDKPNHSGFVRLVTRECMACHDAYPEVDPASARFGQRETFPAELPRGIGCQRCHGPGEAHVRATADPATPSAAIVASIVNPGRLDAGRREDACLQCHLQPSAVRTSFLTRFGHEDEDFRPGDVLAEHVVHVEYPLLDAEADRFEINHHPYRLRQSRCWQASDGALSCLTCHDPHHLPPDGGEVAWYRGRCLTCHSEAGCGREAAPPPAEDRGDCAGCHMPRRRPSDVVHVIMTDHRIARGPAPDPVAAQAVPDPQPDGTRPALYAADPALPPAEAAAYLDLARIENGDFDRGPPLLAALDAAGVDDPQPRFYAGVALLEQGERVRAAEVFRSVLESDPDNHLARLSLASALLETGELGPALEQLEACVARDPDSAAAHLRLGEALAGTGDLDRALAEVERSLALRPLHAEARFTHANLCARAGRREDAIDSFRLAWAVDPTFEAACTRLALSLEKAGRSHEALEVFEQGTAAFPRSAELATRLAVLLLSAEDAALRDPARALALADRAHALAPGEALATLAYGVALHETSRDAEAAGMASLALKQGADRATSLLLQALAERASGHDTAARTLWELAPALLDERPLSPLLRGALLAEARDAFRPREPDRAPTPR